MTGIVDVRSTQKIADMFGQLPTPAAAAPAVAALQAFPGTQDPLVTGGTIDVTGKTVIVIAQDAAITDAILGAGVTGQFILVANSGHGGNKITFDVNGVSRVASSNGSNEFIDGGYSALFAWDDGAGGLWYRAS